MNADLHFRRAQVYRFLAHALLYPTENWLYDLDTLSIILEGLDGAGVASFPIAMGLEALQAEHRHTLGLSGSLPYETEIGLPNEYRQSQEMADIAGFYRAFGFQVGSAVRERPDYLAMELEFMGLLALKQAQAVLDEMPEQVEVCQQAQCSFLQEHLGRWIELFALSLAGAPLDARPVETSFPDRPYLWLARLAADFVKTDAARLGVALATVPLHSLAPTPLAPELSCGTCSVNN